MQKPLDPAEISFSKSGSTLLPIEFHVLRAARKLYKFDADFFSSSGENLQFNYRAVHDLATQMNRKRDLARHPELVVRPGALFAVGLLHQILYYVVDTYWRTVNPALFANMTDWLRREFPAQPVDACVKIFLDTVPTLPLYKGEVDLEQHLAGTIKGKKNPFIALEQMILLYLANENPAANHLQELYDDTELEQRILLPARIESLAAFFKSQPGFGPYNQSLLDLLKAPILASPYSLEGQLDYIKSHWVMLIDPAFLKRILSALDLIHEDEKAGWLGAGPAHVPEFQVGRYGAGDYAEYYAEPERFSYDKDWMPSVVVIAKSVHVWLDQLSRTYQREIRRLDQIPDEELDQLARWGFTGLWLIGLWERSPASQAIKRARGNQEALSSAYSLYDYEIAGDLGGQAALDNLQYRTRSRGIRLASDMVPNHMGLYSRWVVEHPDWFMQLPYPPYPNYSFTGPNLSWDNRVGIRIEDGYWDNRDAAVTFQRVDHWTGETRFIYHGNDGTSMPWNDTAQLNFLIPAVREAVIQLILRVARSFPIIRFDAAMTLTKKHYQRLWFPKPGEGGAIPSRSEHGMTRDEFDTFFPHEFWREVVDRVAAEVPDTLLIAEAFWLTEGFFVRTLGMHRVYNSAFMNMLKMEENSKYRTVVKNILEFDPRIIQRFVNFMNNPDEDTAFAQFGKGDKYFGVAMMMATMPGLPMFGHGQIEGFTEKYGMEFSRAQWNEIPDADLVRRHEEEIFPLMRMRSLFSGAENFVLYDFYTEDGSVNEDVFAYSNRQGSDRALVIYQNKFAHTRGWVRTSAAISEDDGAGGRKLVHKTIAEGLGIDGMWNKFTVFRERRSGLEYLYRNQQVAEQGLLVDLHAYQYYVFTDLREVYDDAEGRYSQLCNKLNGQGVRSIDEAYREMRYEPIMRVYGEFVSGETFRTLFETTNNVVAAEEFAEKSRPFLKQAAIFGGTTGEIETVTEKLESLTITLLSLRDSRDFKAHSQTKETQVVFDYVNSLLPAKVDKSLSVWRVLLGWISVSTVGYLKSEDSRQEWSALWFEEWLLTKVLAGTFMELGADEPTAWREVDLVRALLAHQGLTDQLTGIKKHASVASMLDDPSVQRTIGMHSYQGIRYFHKESFESYMKWLFLINAVHRVAISAGSRSSLLREILQNYTTFRNIDVLAVVAEYQTDKFKTLLGYAVGADRKKPVPTTFKQKVTLVE